MAENGIKELSSLFNSSTGIAIGFFISGIISISTRIALGRILQPANYGLLSEGLVIINFVIVLTLFGLDESIPRFTSHEKNSGKALSSSIVLIAPISIIATVILYIFSGNIATILGTSGLTPVIHILSLNLPAMAIMTLILADFRGNKRTREKVSIEYILVPSFILISSVLLAVVYGKPSSAAIGFTAGGWTGLLVTSLVYLKLYHLSFPSLKDIKSIFRFSLPIWFSNMMHYFILWSNVLILGYLLGSEAAGFFNAAFPISLSLILALTSLNYLYLPIATSLYSRKELEKLEKIYSAAVRWVFATTLPLALILSFKSDLVLEVLFGSSYLPASALLSILSVAFLLEVFFGPLSQMLIAFGNTWKEALSRFLGLSSLIAMSFFFISALGLIGAGIAMLLETLITNSLMLYFNRGKIKIKPVYTEIWKPLVAGLFLSILLLLPTETLLQELLLVPTAFITYAVVLLALKPFKREDIMTIKTAAEETSLPPNMVGALETFTERFSN